MAFSAGQKLTASALNTALQRQIAYGLRTTSSSGVTSASYGGIMRLDSIPIVNGQDYEIKTTPLIFESSVAGDLLNLGFFVSTSGAATTASTFLDALVMDSKSASFAQRTVPFVALYNSTTTGTLSILSALSRASGTGTCKINASADYPFKLWVSAAGPSQNSTAVLL